MSTFYYSQLGKRLNSMDESDPLRASRRRAEIGCPEYVMGETPTRKVLAYDGRELAEWQLGAWRITARTLGDRELAERWLRAQGGATEAAAQDDGEVA